MTHLSPQQKRVMMHLVTYGGLTRKEAQDLYGIGNLPARIIELRNLGYNIETVDTKGKNRYGEKVNYGTYTLVTMTEEEEQNSDRN